MDCPRMMATLRNAAASRQSAAASQKTERAYPTFLHAVRAAIMAESGGSQCTFMHNANLYDLHTALGDSAGSKLLTGRVIEPAAKSGSRGESYFKLWFRSRDASGLPSRIEFRPRSFFLPLVPLRYSGEETRTAGGPTSRLGLIPPGGGAWILTRIFCLIRFESDFQPARQFRTGVSLHGHTLHSKESLAFIYRLAQRIAPLRFALQHGESRYRSLLMVLPMDLRAPGGRPPLSGFTKPGK